MPRYAAALVFYGACFAIYYGALELVTTLFPGILSSTIVITLPTYQLYLGTVIIWALPLALTSILAYLISKRYLGGFQRVQIGIRRKSLLDSFLYVNSINVFSWILLAGEVRFLGFSSVASSLTSAVIPTTPLWAAVPFNLANFLVVGTLAYPLWMAYPANFLKDTHPAVRVILATAIWILLFDGAFIFMGSPPELGDLLLLGFAYMLLYYKFDNSVGVLLAYVITGEWVVLAIPASLGSAVFFAFLYARVAATLGSLGLLMYRRADGRRDWLTRNHSQFRTLRARRNQTAPESRQESEPTRYCL